MKKILLGTSAIVGASVLLASPVWAAEKPKLEMNGYLRFESWFVSQDQAGSTAAGTNRGVEFEMDDVEIHFQGSAKADNGLEYGFYVELQEGSSDGTAGYDEANVFLSGNWGRLDLGSQDSVQNNWKMGGYAIVADKDGAWDGNNTFNAVSNSAYIGTDMAAGAGDANKITYYSPSFGGFQVGVSYTPNTNAGENSGNLADATGDIGGTKNKYGNWSNQYGIGAKYAGTFSDVGVEVTARYQYAKPQETGGTTTATSERENDKEWGFGAKVSYMGFSLAGSYTDLGDGRYTKAQNDAGYDNGYYWDIGLAYGTGPYKVSVAYMQSRAGQGDGVQDDKVNYLALGASYAAAPGLDFYAEYQYVDLDQAGSTSDNQADLFLIGTQVSF